MKNQMLKIDENAEMIDKLTDYVTDTEGTKVRIDIAVYDKPLFHNQDINSMAKLVVVPDELDAPEQPYGAYTYYAEKLTETQRKELMEHFKVNIDKHKYPTKSND